MKSDKWELALKFLARGVHNDNSCEAEQSLLRFSTYLRENGLHVADLSPPTEHLRANGISSRRKFADMAASYEQQIEDYKELLKNNIREMQDMPCRIGV